MNNNNKNIVSDEIPKWEKLLGVCTPGGDPCYRCPKCKSRESEHINGVESQKYWNYCPICGIRLNYW